MRKALYWVLVGIFALIFLISAFVVVDYIRASLDRREDINNLYNDFTDPPTVSTTRPTQAPRPGTTVTTRPGVTTVPTAPTAPTVPTAPVPPTTGIMPTVPTAPEVTEPTEPPHEHSYIITTAQATCTESGFTLYTCQCGHSYLDSSQPPLGHSYGHWKYGTYGNKDVKHPRTRECATCGYVETQNALARFEKYLKINQDVVGWIRIMNDENANEAYNKYLVNYPIMHHPDEKDYYLRRDLYKVFDEDGGGSIYLRENCDILEPTDVMTIYGHAMADGSMFGRLNRYYYYKDFFDQHQYIQLWDLYEEHTYQVVCVFKTSGTYGVGFPFHLFDDFEDEAEYEEFINGVRKLAKYDTGIETEYGDKFICLCTCEYTQNNGRLVLVAKRVCC